MIQHEDINRTRHFRHGCLYIAPGWFSLRGHTGYVATAVVSTFTILQAKDAAAHVFKARHLRRGHVIERREERPRRGAFARPDFAVRGNVAEFKRRILPRL